MRKKYLKKHMKKLKVKYLYRYILFCCIINNSEVKKIMAKFNVDEFCIDDVLKKYVKDKKNKKGKKKDKKEDEVEKVKKDVKKIKEKEKKTEFEKDGKLVINIPV